MPHEEKGFSLFEPHTRWMVKGKAGTPVDLGVPVCIREDPYGFVLHHKERWQGTDVDDAVPRVEAAPQDFPERRAVSFDRGCHRPNHRCRRGPLRDCPALPKKGRLGPADRERESAPEFAALRRRHPAVESAINHREHRGLNRVRTHGADPEPPPSRPTAGSEEAEASAVRRLTSAPRIRLPAPGQPGTARLWPGSRESDPDPGIPS